MRRRVLLMLSVAIVLALVVWAARQRQNTGKHVLLQRALQAKHKAPPAAVLIEMGVKDDKATDWSGNAVVQGAKVIRRTSYRFRGQGKKLDQLIEPNGWKATSHFSVRAPRNPIVRRMEPIATVGVILYLEDMTKNATLTIKMAAANLGEEKVFLKEVLDGTPATIFGGDVMVRRISSVTPVVTGGTEDDCPAATYGPDGTLWVAYLSYTLRDQTRRIEQPRYKKQPKGFQQLNHPDYAEQLFVRGYRNGKWSTPIPVTNGQQDIARCAVAVTNDNLVWVVYSAHRGANFDIFARPVKEGNATFRLGKEVRVSNGAGPDLSPSACVDSSGNVWAAWQSWSAEGPARIRYSKCVDWEWSKPETVELDAKSFGNCWHPVVAAGPDGAVAVAYDVYRGHYDIGVKFLAGERQPKQEPLLVYPGDLFQARPSLTFDADGALWIAYAVGPPKWGKDYGAQDSKDGNSLYNTRSVRVEKWVVRNNGQIAKSEPQAKLPGLDVSVPELPFSAIKTNKFEKRPRQAYPKIGLDGKGRIWLTYRKNFGSRYTSHPGATWRTYARRLDGSTWTPEMEVHHSDGLLDSRPVLLPHADGGLLLVHNTDGRFTTPNKINNEIFMSVVDVSRKHQVPKMSPILGKPAPLHKTDYVLAEEKDVERIRKFRINAAGKQLRLLRGEYHRHTEISWDGAPDGSLEDMFRYAIDAAAFDWIGNGDHDNGAGREYPWWLTQKYSDAYHVAGIFTPMFTYERSVSYPHGHRNVMFAKRGIMTLPRLAAEEGQKKVAGIHPDDTKMLYRYLRQFDGICAVHTSATGMGTDWRDNDPKVEPVVEIYQGDRMSYEFQGAPRAGYDPKGAKTPANVGGWRPLGFVDLALRDKGYKLAFQASSDHWSTHISYFIVLAEKNDRRGILDAVKKRHCYGATDNIILDVRSGNQIQGDQFTTRNAPSLQFNVIGTNKLAEVAVIKNSKVVKTFQPKAQQYQGKWTDPAPDVGMHYYYVRVVQSDGEVAWGSPMWIRTEK